MSVAGVGILKKIYGILNGENYAEIIMVDLPDSLNYPKHKSYVAKEAIEETKI